MKLIDTTLAKLDNYQQSHSKAGFLFAVLTKYGDDEAGYQGALITYYGFLSLFPLLLVASSIISLISRHSQHLREQLTASIGTYFPMVGSQLQSNVHSSSKSGIALIVGLLLTLYGARGGATAFQHALNHIWQVPKIERPGFPASIIKSLIVVVAGGLGLVISAYLAAYTTNFGHNVFIKLASIILSVGILTLTFSLLFKIGTSSKAITKKTALLSGFIAATGIFIIQNLGTYLLTKQLKNLSSLYGTFAIVLGLLFWIYLQVQFMLYAVEIGTIKQLKLWPRSLTQKKLTSADKQLYTRLAQKEQLLQEQKISVKFGGLFGFKKKK